MQQEGLEDGMTVICEIDHQFWFWDVSLFGEWENWMHDDDEERMEMDQEELNI